MGGEDPRTDGPCLPRYRPIRADDCQIRLDAQVDGIAELWFKSQAGCDAYSTSPATKRLRDDGAILIGREIDFITEENVIIS